MFRKNSKLLIAISLAAVMITSTVNPGLVKAVEGVDVEAPTIPSNLTASVIKCTSVTLTWTASTDNVGVAAYDVYRGTTKIGTTATATSYNVIGLSPNTQYSFTIKARDAAGNVASSTAISVLTPVDVEAPSIPTGLSATNVKAISFTLNWAAATDNVGVTGYEVYNGTQLVATTTSRSYSVTGLTQLTSYSFTVKAKDAAGNVSSASEPLVVTTGDGEAPTAPSNLTASDVTCTTATLTWTVSSDNIAVAGYDIYKGTTKVGSTTTATTYNVTGLSPNTQYSFTVKARDAAGNIATSTVVAVLTPVDAEAPSIPAGLKATNIKATSLTLGWTAAIDNVKVTGYEVYNGSQLLATAPSTSYSVAGLTQLTSYSFTVKAKDAAGNVSSASDPLVVTTGDGEAPTAPGNLTATDVTCTTATLTWTVSSDNIAVAGYDIYKGTTKVGSTTTATTYNVTGLSPNTQYSFTVKARDAAGNVATTTSLAVMTPTDVTAPSIPTGLSYSNIKATSLTLSWSAPTDNVGVTGYEVYNGTQLVATTTSRSYSVTGLTQLTSYSFTVKAKDAAGNVSSASEPLVVTTIDGEAPTTPTNLTATDVTCTTLTLSWTASTDNIGVTAYDVYKGTAKLGTTSTATTYNVVGLSPNTQYSFTVKAKDAVGNVATSTALELSTIADTEAPTLPTGVKSSNLTGTSLTLTWTASTDNVGIKEYEVYNGTELIGTTTSRTFNVTGLTQLSDYSFTVKAKDAAGNVSAPSTPLIVTTLESEPPTAPANFTAMAVTCTTLTLTWSASLDNVGVTAYDIYKGSTKLGSTTTALTYAVTGLTPNTLYSFTVKAKDAVGNVSPSADLTVTTPIDTEAPSAPTNLVASTVTCNSFTLKWAASTDNVKVTGYDIYNGSTIVGSTTTALTYNLTGLTQDTVYSFTVKAKDAAGNVSEGNTALTVVIPKPSDLIITDISYSPSIPSEGEDVTFLATIKNIGEGATTDGILHKVEFSLNGETVVFWSDNYTKPINPGQSVTIRVNKGSSTSVWKAVRGSHTIQATVDSGNLIAETNKQNNSYSEIMLIEESCDLVVTNILAVPGNPIAGESVKLSATIKNIGKNISPAGRPYRVGFYIDDNTEAIVWADDYDWCIESQQSINVTAVSGKDSPYWLAAEGTHKITAIVDDVSLIKESNETNNSFSKDVVVTAARVYNPQGDYDGDGLINEYEKLLGTDALNGDTDGDYLSDFDELNTYYTDPLNADTDRDGIYDSSEIKLSLDPLTVDPNSEKTRSARTVDEKATITVTGDSNILAAPLQIVNTENVILNSIEGIIGKAVEVSLGGYKMSSTKITFKYNINELSGILENNLTIYWVDTDNKTLVPIASEKLVIDKEACTITADVAQFGTFLLGNSSLLPDLSGLDIVFDIDQSGSMSSSDKDYYRLRAVKRFVQGMNSINHRSGIVEFADAGKVKQELTNNITTLESILNSMRYVLGSTNMGDGLLKAGPLFDISSRKKVIILFTDGENNTGYTDGQVVDISRNLNANNNIIIITVGLGSGVDKNLLQQIASAADGEYYYIDNSTGLGQQQIDTLYFQIMNKLTLNKNSGTIFNPIVTVDPTTELKDNLARLGYTDAHTDFQNTVNIFVSQFYDGITSLKVVYDKLPEGAKISVLLGWTKRALDGSITRNSYDVNRDSIVDTKDLDFISSAYNEKSGDSAYDPNLDLNDDNIIDIFDIVLISSKINE